MHAASRGLDRRDFLRFGAGAAAGVAAVTGLTLPTSGRIVHRPGLTPGRARNLIFMVADGMSFGTLTIADTMFRVHEGRASTWASLWERPGVSRTMQMTQCADAFVTDSAAAAAGWGCGFACNTGVLNITPDGKQHLPLLVHAKQNGRATGVVTTARITHATPAGFCVNVPHRDLEDAIAMQQLERGIDLLLGGGAKHFPPDLLAKHPEWNVVRTRAELAAAPGSRRLLGVFADAHVPHVLDRGPDIPSLEEMAMAALTRLDTAPDGFALQIEGGRVDHAAHDNDAASLVHEQMEFDRTLAAVLKWMGDRDDTLLIVTTDHGNANPGLTLYGKRGEQGLERLMGAKQSFEWIFSRMPKVKKDPDAVSKIGELVEKASGVTLDAEAMDLFVSVLKSGRVSPFRDANSATSVLGGVLASTYGVAFASPNHTSDMVELTALGPGSSLMKPTMRNRDIWGVIVEAMGFAPGQPLEGMERLIRLKGVDGD